MKKTLLFGEPMALLLADTPGALECVEHFTRRMSGAEVNVAIGLTRLGFPVEYLTRLGDDPFGHYIEQALKDNGIGTNLLTYDTVYRTGIQLKEYVEDGAEWKILHMKRCRSTDLRRQKSGFHYCQKYCSW